MFYLKSPNKKWWRWEIRAVDIQPSTKTRIVSGKKWDFLWLFWRIWTDITHELKSNHSKAIKKHGAPTWTTNVFKSSWSQYEFEELPLGCWEMQQNPLGGESLQGTITYAKHDDVLGSGWEVVRSQQEGTVNSCPTDQISNPLRWAECYSCFGRDGEIRKGHWRRCKPRQIKGAGNMASQLQVNSSKKLLNSKVPHTANPSKGVRNVVRHHRTVVIQMPVIWFLSWTNMNCMFPGVLFDGKLGDCTDQERELNGVQKHHISILPCSNCFPMFPSIGRMRLIHIARHIPLVLWWTTVSWMCKLWEFLCFCVQSFDSLTNCWRQKVLRWTQLGGFITPSGNSQMSRSRNATSLAYQELLNEK